MCRWDKKVTNYKYLLLTLKTNAMKKVLFLAVAATMLFAACNKTEVVYDNDPQEISFLAVNKVATKAPVADATFLAGDNMDVVAYLSEGDGVTPNTYFAETLFSKNGTYWKGGRYWPISDATLNFLAVTNTGGGVAGHVENVFTTTASAQSVVATLTGNEDKSQTDLMFAAGQGTRTAGGAYPQVSMVFKHALSWINFKVWTGTTAAGAPTITVNSITLNDVVANGSLAVNNPKYAALNTATGTDACTTDNLTATWTPGPAVDLVVLKGDDTNAADALALDGTAKAFGNGVLVVPGDEKTFTINYTINDGTSSNTFDYTYTPTSPIDWEMAHKYTYNVKISLTEIEIDPSVTIWDEDTDGDGNVDADDEIPYVIG